MSKKKQTRGGWGGPHVPPVRKGPTVDFGYEGAPFVHQCWILKRDGDGTIFGANWRPFLCGYAIVPREWLTEEQISLLQRVRVSEPPEAQ